MKELSSLLLEITAQALFCTFCDQCLFFRLVERESDFLREAKCKLRSEKANEGQAGGWAGRGRPLPRSAPSSLCGPLFPDELSTPRFIEQDRPSEGRGSFGLVVVVVVVVDVVLGGSRNSIWKKEQKERPIMFHCFLHHR